MHSRGPSLLNRLVQHIQKLGAVNAQLPDLPFIVQRIDSHDLLPIIPSPHTPVHAIALPGDTVRRRAQPELVQDPRRRHVDPDPRPDLAVFWSLLINVDLHSWGQVVRQR